MKDQNVLVYIDSNVTRMKSDDYNNLWDNYIKRNGVHFDDSPFGACFCIADNEENRNNCDLIKKHGINEKFNIEKYVKKSWEKWESRTREIEFIPAIERMNIAKNDMFVMMGMRTWKEVY